MAKIMIVPPIISTPSTPPRITAIDSVSTVQSMTDGWSTVCMTSGGEIMINFYKYIMWLKVKWILYMVPDDSVVNSEHVN